MVASIGRQVKEGVQAVDIALFQYFYGGNVVEAEPLYFALTVFEQYYRSRTSVRVYGSIVETLGNLQQVMSAIQDILEIWQFGPPEEGMLALDQRMGKLLVRSRRRRTGLPEFRAIFGLQ